jgi:surface antigen
MNKTRLAITAAAAVVLALVPATAAQAATYGPYKTLASPSLNERSAPSTSAAVVGSLPYGSTVYIACQTSGSLVGSSSVWDRLSNGTYISDYWTTTPGQNTWTSSIPRCGTSSTPTATVGRTVSYNEGASGQCTWWAIDRFHWFSGYYPNLVAPGNNGNAQYWAGNAAYNGWTVTATPRVNSIAVFPPYTNGAGSVGHVAWVTSVSGGQITVSEVNYVGFNTVDTRTLVPASTVRYILAP